MEQLSRRQFGQFAARCGLLLSLGWSVVLEGCASFATIRAWVTTGLDAFASVIDLLAGNGVITIVLGSAIDLLIKGVKAAIADVGTAVDNYNNAAATAKATLVGKISTALVVAQNEIGQFWADVNIPDPKIASTISGLLGLIVSQLAYFATLLPPAPTPVQVRVFPKALAVVPQKRSIGQFKSAFRGILEANGFNQFKRF